MHGVDIPKNFETGIRQLYDKGRKLLMSRCVGVGLRHNNGDIGNVCRRDVPFIAVQYVIIPVFDRRRFHPRCICAASFLGHGVADSFLTSHKRLEESFMLVLGAVVQQRHHCRVIRTLGVQREGSQNRLT